jgi:ubiquinone/menaquinone biosynthesis C-methylase UbiE
VQTNSTLEISSDAAREEEERIKSVYAKRVDDDIRYSCFNPGELFMMQGRERQILGCLKRYGIEHLSAKKILEIGCGTGHWLREFIIWGARPENLSGVDLLADRVAEARRCCPAGVNVQCGSAAKLAFADNTFDVVLQSTVFTSVLDFHVKQRIASEMLRVMKQDGLIIWYDYHVNNPRNSDVRGVKKKEIFTLFPRCQIDLRRVTLAPPLVRSIAPHSWLWAYLLERIPLLCTHYVGIIQKG